MELIPQEIREQIPPLYFTENMNDDSKMVYCKLFIEGWTWLILEMSMDNETCFGFVISPFCDGELGYFTLSELSEIKSNFGIGVERDLNFQPVSLSNIRQEVH